jgi:hypothetical protein
MSGVVRVSADQALLNNNNNVTTAATNARVSAPGASRRWDVPPCLWCAEQHWLLGDMRHIRCCTDQQCCAIEHEWCMILDDGSADMSDEQ